MLSRTQINKSDGFTLLEMIIVLVIVGLAIAALLEGYVSWETSLKHAKTKENTAIIADALSAYAARNYRIPCPADPAGAGTEPFGYEIGSGAEGTDLGSCDNVAAGETEGIIPFATLGLNALTIRDGWGNYFTYQVSPTFTRNPEDPDTLVHARCRTTDWIEGVVLLDNGGSQWLDGGRNIAPLKARFCCAQTDGNQTEVFSSPPPTNTPASIFRPDPDTWYERVNVLVDPYDDHSNENGITPADDPDPVTQFSGAQPYYDTIIYGGTAAVSGHTDMPVYALISHGENAAGAFIGNQTANRIDTTGSGAAEILNADSTSQQIYDLPRNQTNDNTYYDDIVFWQSQTDLLARLRQNSCVLP